MLIRIMKQEALNLLKANLDDIYVMYYKEYNNKWIYELFNGNPFVDFKEVPNFDLSTLDLKNVGEIDFNNCKILQKNLALTPSQASDERLWAGLCHDVFYDYVRKRWKMNDRSKEIPPQKKAVGMIQTRFFYKGGKRAGIYRNTLSKCWWVGKLTKGPLNDYALLNKLGYLDLSTKINDIFRNYTFASNADILKGIIEGIGYFNDEGIKLGIGKDVRPVLQYINAVGGGTLLDYWTSDEIRDLFIEQQNNFLNGISTIEGSDLTSDDEEDNTNEEYDSIVEELFVADEELTVSIGCRVKTKEINTEKERTYTTILNGQITDLAKIMLKKKIGDEFEFDEKKFIIVDIEL